MLFLINYFKKKILKSIFYSFFVLFCLCFFFSHLHYAGNWEIMLFVWTSCLWFTEFFDFQLNFIPSIVSFTLIFSFSFFVIFKLVTFGIGWQDHYFLEEYIIYTFNSLIAITPIFANVGLKKIIQIIKKAFKASKSIK